MHFLSKLLAAAVIICTGSSVIATSATGAPLAAGKQKYLGGIYSGGTSNQEAGIPLYWNQVTPENACKWGSVEATRGVYNWAAADLAYYHAKNNGLPFRFHVLLWGAQQPAWIRDLPDSEQLDAIKAWFAAVHAHFPDIDYLEVVNEGLHDKPDITWFNSYLTNVGTTDCGNYKKALGGDGASGWEWVVRAFRLARQYFPNTKLMLNDYGIINDGNATNQYVTVINLLKAENLIDVIAEQAHAFNTALPTSATTMTNNLNTLGATGLPIWITEFDIDGGTSSVPNDYTNIDANKARMQAPRSLWDPNYVEDSWIGQWNRSFLPLLPNIKQSIDTFYPGTKFAMTEYAYGGEAHISGGIAQADVLGIFGKSDVYLATLWPWGDDHTYTAAAFKLYLNYDGAGKKFGDTSISATPTDVALCSTYASLEDTSSRLHVIVLNKSYDTATAFNFSIAGATAYASARVYGFDSTSATITERTAITSINGNQFSYTLPALTAAHFVLEAPSTAAPVFTTQPSSAVVIAGDAVTFDAAASGTPAPTYQWKKNGTSISGATNSSYTIASASGSDSGSYTVVAANSAGSVTSNVGLLTVIVPPSNAVITITVE